MRSFFISIYVLFFKWKTPWRAPKRPTCINRPDYRSRTTPNTINVLGAERFCPASFSSTIRLIQLLNTVNFMLMLFLCLFLVGMFHLKLIKTVSSHDLPVGRGASEVYLGFFLLLMLTDALLFTKKVMWHFILWQQNYWETNQSFSHLHCHICWLTCSSSGLKVWIFS